MALLALLMGSGAVGQPHWEQLSTFLKDSARCLNLTSAADSLTGRRPHRHFPHISQWPLQSLGTAPKEHSRALCSQPHWSEGNA